MKHLFLFLLLLFFQHALFSQQTKTELLDTVSKIKVTSFQYDLGNTEKCPDAVKLPFNKINFKDVRFDTSFITLNWQSNTTAPEFGMYNKKFTLHGGLAQSLTSYVSYYYAADFSTKADAELVCYIKQFVIHANDSLLSNPFQKFTAANIEIEVFYKKGDMLFPAFRIDTAYEYEPEKIKKEFSLVVKELAAPLFQKISKMDTGKITKRNAYTQDQVTDRYQNRFNIPILNTNTYNKGIYKSFAEFKNNAPSITEFTLKKDLLYDSNNNIINPLDIFGFSDGKTCWIMRSAVRNILSKTDEEIDPKSTQSSTGGSLLFTITRDIATHPQLSKARYDRGILSKVGNSFEFEFLMPYINNSHYADFYLLLFSLNVETGKID